MAKYKSLPNYELARSNIYAHFNCFGIYETNNPEEIAVLDDCKPFIRRIDEPASKPKTKQSAKTKTAKA